VATGKTTFHERSRLEENIREASKVRSICGKKGFGARGNGTPVVNPVKFLQIKKRTGKQLSNTIRDGGRKKQAGLLKKEGIQCASERTQTAQI